MENNINIKNANPKETANILSKLTFKWFTRFCVKSVRKDLNVDDLYVNLSSDKSDVLSNLLENNWNYELKNSKSKHRSPSLLRAIRKTFFGQYMLMGLFMFVQLCIIRPIQPALLSVFIGLFSSSAIGEENKNDNFKDKCLYGGLIISISFILIFFDHHTNLILNQIGMRVRIACSSLIYRKTLRLSQKSLNVSASGQIVNLLSNDVVRFDLVAMYLHHIWIMPILLPIVTYYIYLQVGVSAIIGVGFLMILTIPVHLITGKLSSILRLKVAERTDSRVKKMAEIISGIHVIKMYAWEKPFAKVIELSRIKEINVLSWVSYIRGITISSTVFIERTIMYVTVVSYVLFGHHITAQKVFAMVQFFNLLQHSLAGQFPLATNIGGETLVSIKRLQKFLLLEERVQSEIIRDKSKAISLKSVTASWVPDVKVLKNINLTIPSGCLCAVVGPVGAGKSSLLHLLLGELVPERGTVKIGGHISYASQEAWLFASTVRKNILFGQKYDRKLYREVVKVCALEKDFKLLPHGDKTYVGDRGVSLSGGQKARINLARAIYSNGDIFLLDDPLSAVDTHVGKHLFEECIINYLRSRTRVLVTHQLHFLKKADHIVVLNQGKIEAQGTFQQLSNSELDFTKMLGTAEKPDDPDNPQLERDLDSLRRSMRKRKDSVRSTISMRSDLSINLEVTVFEDHEETISTEGGSVYWQYARAGGNVCVLFMLGLFLLAGQVASNGLDFFIAYWTYREGVYLSKHNETLFGSAELVPQNRSEFYNDSSYKFLTEEDYDYAIWTTLAIYVYTCLIITSIILLISRSVFFYKVAMNSSKNLHNWMFGSLLLTPMKFFDTNPCGRILNRFSRDMGIIDEILPRIVLEAIQIFLVTIGILLMVTITNPFMLIVIALLGIIFYKMRKWYVTIARNIKHLEGITKSPVFSHINASLNGITTIRASDAEQMLMKEFDLHQDTHTSAWYTIIVCISAFGLWIDLLCFVFIFCVIYGFIFVSQYNEVNGSFVGLAISHSLILIVMVQHGIRQTAEVVSQMTCVERVLEYTKLEQEEPQETPKETRLPIPWPNSGAITFTNVSLKYSEYSSCVLRNLNFNIKGGEKIGIVGRTGAGKSSLLAALFRLAPIDGHIYIDDIETSTVSLTELRKSISIIPQEPVLFSATLRYNLDPFEEFSDDELWKVLEDVELKDVASTLDFLVQEGGSNFSVGQRQLLCLARAILRNNKILVLDEATANVDPKTDNLIQDTIRTKFNSCTVLTIAHRLHTIMDSDKVLVMDAGCLVEFDRPHKLLCNKVGFFFKMVEEAGPSISKQLQAIAKNTYESWEQDEKEEKSETVEATRL